MTQKAVRVKSRDDVEPHKGGRGAVRRAPSEKRRLSAEATGTKKCLAAIIESGVGLGEPLTNLFEGHSIAFTFSPLYARFFGCRQEECLLRTRSLAHQHPRLIPSRLCITYRANDPIFKIKCQP